MSCLEKFYLLQYKNWKLQYRKKLVTLAEIIIPVLLCLTMVGIRSFVPVSPVREDKIFHHFYIEKFPSIWRHWNQGHLTKTDKAAKQLGSKAAIPHVKLPLTSGNSSTDWLKNFVKDFDLKKPFSFGGNDSTKLTMVIGYTPNTTLTSKLMKVVARRLTLQQNFELGVEGKL